VPAFGYRLLRFAVAGRPGAGAHPEPLGLSGPVAVESAGWRLEIEPETGAIRTLVNRRTGATPFTGPAHLGLVVDDSSDTWSHGLDRYPVDGVPLQCGAITLMEQGPIRHAVEICAAHGESRLRTTILLPEDAGLPVELRVVLDWRERNRLLRLAYPIGASCFEYEIPAGWIARPDDGREGPGHRWVRAARHALLAP